jgi:site-specific DNA recombinase
MNIAAYVRVSTDEQADKGNSIFEQQERLSAYCRAMGWQEPTFYIDDGYSAKNLKRPAITRLLENVENKSVSTIIATKLDRVCRNLLDLLNAVEIFEKNDCRFVSASESFDTSTAAGRMTLHLLGMFAEFERERISERVKDNMLSLARNTDKALSIPCFGYEIVGGRYAINHAEAEHVRFAFDLAEQGKGSRTIAKLLNERGVTTKRGKSWDQVNVKRLMANETLKGWRIFNKRKSVKGKIKMRPESEWIVAEDNHPAIIESERFDRVQQIVNSRKRTHARSESETYLLTGVIYCKLCGGRMKGQTSRHRSGRNPHDYFRYICSNYVLGYGCRHHAIHRDELEQFVIGQMKRIAEATDAQIEQMLGVVKSNEQEISASTEQLAKIEKRMQKQIEAYENDLISAHDLKLARQRIEQERTKLEEHIAELKRREVNPSQVRANIVGQMDDILGTDRIIAKTSMSMLIEQILVDAPSVDIVWRI